MCVVALGPIGAPDPHLPTLGAALHPAMARHEIAARLGPLTAGAALRAIVVKAYKPGRRCVIEYQFDMPATSGTRWLSILGKIRANRFGNSGFRQLRALWDAGFDDASSDGISVPEPLGTVPALRMWLQRKVPGAVATDLLCRGDGDAIAERVADAIGKLHRCGVAAARRHRMDDELQILSRCLDHAAGVRPELRPRIHRLIDCCARVGGLLPTPAWCSSHRDFYSDQVLVANDRLYLLDFDLFCQADPGLDLGNFLGHVTELALRVRADGDAFAEVERRVEDRFVALAGERVRWAVRVYAALTIARHVYLSTRFADRTPWTAVLLSVAEARLHEVAAQGGFA